MNSYLRLLDAGLWGNGLRWPQRLSENFSFLRGNLLILTLSWILWFPAMRMIDPYGQLYITDLGATTIILGVINALSTVVLAFIRVPGGYVADRFGRRKIIITMTLGVALAYLFYALAPSWEWILAGAVISNTCLMYQPALMAMRADSVPPGKRGTGFALADFLSGVACIPAPMIAIYLVSTRGRVEGMRIVYLVAVGFGIGATVLRMFLKETLPKREKNPKTENLKELREDFKREYSDAVKLIFKKLPNLAVLYMIDEFAIVGCTIIFQLFAVDFLGLSNEEWGLVYMMSAIVYLITLMPIGIMGDKVGRRKTTLFLLVLIAFSGFLSVTAPPRAGYTMIVLFAAFSMFFLANTLYSSILPALEADLVPRAKRGRVAAALMLLSSLAGAAGQAFAGFAYERINPRFPLFILIALMTTCFFIVAFFIKEPKEREL